MTSVDPYFIPVFEYLQEPQLRECAYDGQLYEEFEMVQDHNPHPSVWVAMRNVEAHVSKMTRELELNEPYKF